MDLNWILGFFCFYFSSSKSVAFANAYKNNHYRFMGPSPKSSLRGIQSAWSYEDTLVALGWVYILILQTLYQKMSYIIHLCMAN